jgi:GH18 family chitinase
MMLTLHLLKKDNTFIKGIFIFLLAIMSAGASAQRIVGYLPAWVEQKKNPDGSFTFELVASTHINIAFLTFKGNWNGEPTKIDFNTDFASVAFDPLRVAEVEKVLNGPSKLLTKAHKLGTTISVAIGGATDYAFLKLLKKYHNDDKVIDAMAQLITNFVLQHNLDGVDLDLEAWWKDDLHYLNTEEIANGNGIDAGKGLTRLAMRLRLKMPDKLISGVVFATNYFGSNYDPLMAQYMDWIGVMTYDFTGSWNKTPLGPHSSLYKIPAGLYADPFDQGSPSSAEETIERWNITEGIPKYKLLLGVPTYGYDFVPYLNTLNETDDKRIKPVAISYKEILQEFPHAAISYDVKDPKKLNGYIEGNGKKIWFETPRGAAEKVRFSKEQGYGGCIVWDMAGDATDYNSPSTSNGNTNNIISKSILRSMMNARASTCSALPWLTRLYHPGEEVNYFGHKFKALEVTTDIPTITERLFDHDGNDWARIANCEGVTPPNPNKNPFVSRTEPGILGRIYTFSQPITFSGEAYDVDGHIAKLEFYSDDTKIGEMVPNPISPLYSWDWNNAAEGTHYVSVKAIDNLGAFATSYTPFYIHVQKSSGPTIKIISPVNHQIFTAPGNIVIDAEVTDTKGVIESVEFFEGSRSIGIDHSQPFSITWEDVPPGIYSISATVIDASGASGSSSVVSISVMAPGAGPQVSCDGTSPYILNRNYSLGSEVTNNDFLYECKVPGWCNQPAYKPGNGMYWTDAWTLKGTCTPLHSNSCESTLLYNASTTYGDGSQVINDGKIYQCRPWPYSGWCSIGGNYTPGSGTHWQDAWTFIGTCTAGSSNENQGSAEEHKILQSIYPNPVQENKLHIDLENDNDEITIIIKDLNGEKKISRTYENVKSLDLEIPPQLKGMFILEVTTPATTVIERLRIQ